MKYKIRVVAIFSDVVEVEADDDESAKILEKDE